MYDVHLKRLVNLLAQPFSFGGYGPLRSRPRGFRRINLLNRSRHWPRASSYADARLKAPHPYCNNPVR